MECFYIAKKTPDLIAIKTVTDTLNTEENQKSHFENIPTGLEILKNRLSDLLKKILK
ncbi:hypothetical protein [Thermotomaculum hydrothermale]|uniref:hypothetical protein n=1 Tax=Thermotomaculum hydrothermale TaxID=981385 RepID=UPI0019157B57|nr:hypothetical protein [Thermotomaculum hydrothermale]